MVRKFLSLLVLLALTVSAAVAKPTTIYKAYVDGNMSDWRVLMDQYAKTPNMTSAQKRNLVNMYYGYIGYAIKMKQSAVAQTYVEKGEAIIDELIAANTYLADMYAYKGAFIGFRIGLAPMKAPFLGKSSVEYINKSLATEKNNILGNIQKGNQLYYAPAAFGGNKVEAKRYYLRAVSLYEANSALCKQNWQYLNLLAVLGRVYVEEKNYEAAKAVYDKALTVEPQCSLIKKTLYPELEKHL